MNSKHTLSKVFGVILLLALSIQMCATHFEVYASSALKVSTKKVTIMVGDGKKVSSNQTVKWTSSNKKIATVKKISPKKAKIQGKKAGNCKIKATHGKKSVTIKVVVKKTQTVKPSPTTKPAATEEPTPTTSPVQTEIPTTVATPTAPAPIQDQNEPLYMNTVSGVSIDVVECNGNKGTFHIKNDNSYDIAFGEKFIIEKYENGMWEKVQKNQVVVLSYLNLVLGGGDYMYSIDWTDSYGELEAGRYRVVKEYYFYSNPQESCYIGCEFSVGN